MKYFYNTKTMKSRPAGGDYSTASGPYVEGERIIFGKITIPAGTEAVPHSHPNEQFIIMLEGRMSTRIEGKGKTVGPGDLIHIPANAVHSAKVVGDEDAVFITAKDTSWGIVGMKEEAAKASRPRKPAAKKKTVRSKR